jgi:hypothetical protein
MPVDDGVQHSRRVVHLAVPAIPGLFVPFAHHDCIHNQIISVHNRVCGVVPHPSGHGIMLMRMGAKFIKYALPKTEQEELGLFFQKYTGNKFLRYQRALDNLLKNGLVKSGAGCSMFVKCEKLDPVKINPDTRAIQFREAEYCVALASFLKPMEHLLYSLKLTTPHIRTRTRVVGKGLNQVERASLLIKKMEAFDNPRVISLDCKRFDQHVSYEALQVEHSVYLASNPDPWFRQLLSWQLLNTVRSSLGMKYVTRGKRMSGDMNTALGNCVQMIAMVVGVMEWLEVDFDLLDDGDDCLLFVEATDLPLVQAQLPLYFLLMGHELKVESVASELTEVEWCQSKPVFDGQKWKFVRNPFKVMSCALVGTRWNIGSERVRLEYLAGIAQCELVLNSGVPVLQEFAKALLRNSKDAHPRYDRNSGEWWRYVRELRYVGPQEIAFDSRISFAKAFGVSVEEQLHYERVLAAWNFEVGPLIPESVSRDPETWVDCRDEHLEFQEGYI